LDKVKTKLFSIGIASLFCSFLFAIVFKVYATFVFKPQYYHSLKPPEQQEWWYKIIDLQQSSELFHTPSAQILLSLTLCTAMIGFSLMSISMIRRKKVAERENRERVEQWFRENPRKKKRRT
jgi:Ni,Fe-hydrogenase I cytochrome b subunit